MDSKEKKQLSESDIKAKFITPALLKAGWDEMTQIRSEVTLSTTCHCIVHTRQ